MVSEDRAALISAVGVGSAVAAVGAYGTLEAAVIAGTLGPLAQATIAPALRRWAEWVERLGERAAGEGGVEALARHLEANPEAAALLSDAAYVSARTTYEHKLEVIGQAMADGVLYETGTAFDVEAQVVRLVCRLERPHVAVLSALPEGADLDTLSRELRQLAPVTHGLVGELVALGLVEEGPRWLPAASVAPRGVGWEMGLPTRVVADGKPRAIKYLHTELGQEVLARFTRAAKRRDTVHP